MPFIINLTEYKTVYDNIKGVMFKDKFYSKSEYEEIIKQEGDTLQKRIAEIDRIIQEVI